MPIIYFKLIMAALVLALCAITVMGWRVSRGLPALGVPSLKLPYFRFALPRIGAPRRETATDPNGELSQRARKLAALRKQAEVSRDGSEGPETAVEETMRSLEQAFESFEAGRISVDTYRSLLQFEKRAAVRRRVGLAASDDAHNHQMELSQADAAVEAVEWCLNWIDEFEQLRVSAKSLFNPPGLAPMAYS